MKTPTFIKNAAHEVRDGLRAARSFSAEYLHTTIEGVVDDLEARYPAPGKGSAKLRFARILLAKILSSEYVQKEWPFIAGLISEIVEIKK